MAKGNMTTDAPSRKRLHIRWKPEDYWLIAIIALLAIYLVSTVTGALRFGTPLTREGSLVILLLCAHISILLLVMHIVCVLVLTHISTGMFTTWAYRRRLRDIWTWLPAAMFFSGDAWPLVVMAQSGNTFWPWWWTEWAIGISVANLLVIIPLIQALMRSVTPKYFLKALLGWEEISRKDLEDELAGDHEQTWRIVVHDMTSRSIVEGRHLVLKEVLNALEKRAVKLLLIAPPESATKLSDSLCIPFLDAARIASKADSTLAMQAICSRLDRLASFANTKGVPGGGVAFKDAAEALRKS
jgi:hypothetical protein